MKIDNLKLQTDNLKLQTDNSKLQSDNLKLQSNNFFIKIIVNYLVNIVVTLLKYNNE